MRLQIIFATGNQDKVREIREIMNDPQLRIASLKDAGLVSDPQEDGWTFEANAIIKAKAVANLLRMHGSASWARERQEIMEQKDQFTPAKLQELLAATEIPLLPLPDGDPKIPLIVMAEDSGLVIDALNGEPGIQTARYLGHDTSHEEKMKHILMRMEGVPEEKRTARFVAAMAACLPNGASFTVRGEVEGHIAHEICGQGGFGYDPIFYLPELGKTTAELTDDEKNRISHRGRACRLMLQKLGEIYEEGIDHQ